MLDLYDPEVRGDVLGYCIEKSYVYYERPITRTDLIGNVGMTDTKGDWYFGDYSAGFIRETEFDCLAFGSTMHAMAGSLDGLGCPF